MSDRTSRSARPVTAQQAALAYLRDRIAEGALAPDDRIGQEQIALELGSSVIPVREALKILEAEGQVVYAPRRGYHVARLSLKDLVEAYRIRRLLEDEAVRVAVPRLTPSDLGVLEAAIVDVEKAGAEGDILAMAAANRRFHFAVFDAADMPRLTNFIRMLWESTDPYRSRYYAEPASRELVDSEHRAVLAALRAGDAEAVVTLLRAHRDNAIEGLSRLLAGDAQP
jgi:DNA-binding GntR family transcriptional regulator